MYTVIKPVSRPFCRYQTRPTIHCSLAPYNIQCIRYSWYIRHLWNGRRSFVTPLWKEEEEYDNELSVLIAHFSVDRFLFKVPWRRISNIVCYNICNGSPPCHWSPYNLSPVSLVPLLKHVNTRGCHWPISWPLVKILTGGDKLTVGPYWLPFVPSLTAGQCRSFGPLPLHCGQIRPRNNELTNWPLTRLLTNQRGQYWCLLLDTYLTIGQL